MIKQKKIVVIGAGFSGLAAAIELQKTGLVSVMIYDGNRPHEKASSIASGIIHPFPGQHAKPAKFFEEAISQALAFFLEAEKFSSEKFSDHQGIYRVAVTDKQYEEFRALSEKFPFVHSVEKGFYPLKAGSKGIEIDLARTIFSKPYLKALETWFLKLGGTIQQKQVETLEDLISDFDEIVVAAGKNSRELLGLPSLKFHKGQILQGTFKKNCHLEKSVTGKGYLAITEFPNKYALGSTYEHADLTYEPTEEGKLKILDDAKTYLNSEDFIVEEIRSSFRVTKNVNNLPLVCKLKPQIWAITAMGSRGLLYHAFAAKQLKDAMIFNAPIMNELKEY